MLLRPCPQDPLCTPKQRRQPPKRYQVQSKLSWFLRVKTGLKLGLEETKCFCKKYTTQQDHPPISPV